MGNHRLDSKEKYRKEKASFNRKQIVYVKVKEHPQVKYI